MLVFNALYLAVFDLRQFNRLFKICGPFITPLFDLYIRIKYIALLYSSMVFDIYLPFANSSFAHLAFACSLISSLLLSQVTCASLVATLTIVWHKTSPDPWSNPRCFLLWLVPVGLCRKPLWFMSLIAAELDKAMRSNICICEVQPPSVLSTWFRLMLFQVGRPFFPQSNTSKSTPILS